MTTMSKRRRTILIVLAILVGVPVLTGVGYLIWRPSPPKNAPRIGLSMASSFVIQRPIYEDALARAGGRSVLITPTDSHARLEIMLDKVDALLLTGGDDITPTLYEGDLHDAGSTDRRRDEFEIRLIRAALDRRMPILGICRGIQILNVAHGGSIQNLRDDDELSARHGIDFNSFTAHDIHVTPGTHLADAIGPGTHQVNSFHGQAVDRVGQSLRACATADDGVIEAIEHPDHAFVIGIQWHPEISSLTDDSALTLLRALVRQADAYRNTIKTAASAAPEE